MEPHPYLYIVGWITKSLSIKVIDLCHVSISICKFYQKFVACGVDDMDECHILLVRPWQHDVNAIKRISICSIEVQNSCHETNSTYSKVYKRKKKPKFISICNRGEFLVESKKTK